MATIQDDRAETLITLTVDIVAAHASNNRVSAEGLPALISRIYGALEGLGAECPVEEKREPAVSIRASVKPDHIVCLEDGKKMKMLKRHLMSHHGLTPAEYRDRWGLPAGYPMVAHNYGERRREIAMQTGLGRGLGQTRGRKKKAPAEG
jgi:predicted transcriptional regulator